MVYFVNVKYKKTTQYFVFCFPLSPIFYIGFTVSNITAQPVAYGVLIVEGGNGKDGE